METFINDKGEEIVIATMDKHRLVHSIAKYAKLCGMNEMLSEKYTPVVDALKVEAFKRLSDKEAEQE